MLKRKHFPVRFVLSLMGVYSDINPTFPRLAEKQKAQAATRLPLPERLGKKGDCNTGSKSRMRVEWCAKTIIMNLV